MKKTLITLSATLLLSTSVFASPYLAIETYKDYIQPKLPVKQGFNPYKRELVEVKSLGNNIHRKYDLDKSHKEMMEAALIRGKKMRDMIEEFEADREERICKDRFMKKIIDKGGKITDYYRYSGGKRRMTKITVDSCD